MVWGILLSSLPAVASTTLLDEDFGDHVSATCGPAWVADCEQNWQSPADAESIELCGTETDDGVVILGDDVGDQSIWRRVPLAYNEPVLNLRVSAESVNGKPNVRAALRFRSATLAPLGVVSTAHELEEDESGALMLQALAPPGAQFVDAIIRVEDAEGDTRVTSVGLTSAPKSEAGNAFLCQNAASQTQMDLMVECQTLLDGMFVGSCHGTMVPNTGDCQIQCFAACITDSGEDPGPEDEDCVLTENPPDGGNPGGGLD